MSKLQHLNARVAKLLTQAVYEVLEVVKETVSEYQEKTARTQRENESLKRRLQELQDEITIERSGLNSLDSHSTEDHLSQRQNGEHSHTEQKEISCYKPVSVIKGDSKELGNTIDSQTQAQAEACGSKAKNVTHKYEEEVTAHTSHISSTANNSINPVPIRNMATTIVEANLSVVKEEPGPTEEFSKAVPSLYKEYTACLNLNRNTSHQLSAPVTVFTEPQRPVFVHSSFASKRNTHSKTSRISFDVTKVRTDYIHSEEPHLCVVCGKTFSRVGNLRIHQRCHTGEKPYGCVQCGRRFTQAGDLKKHKRVHTGEKPYYCNQCGKSFSRRENLKRHQRIHIGETLMLQEVRREQHI